MGRLPSLTARQLLALLKRGGFIEEYQRGSHLYLVHPITERRTSIPMHPGTIKRGLMKHIMRQAGLGEEEFRDLI